MGCLCKFLNIQNRQCRIGDGLAEDRLRIVLECRLQLLLRAVGGDKRGRDAHLGHRDRNQVEGSAINGGRRNDVIPALADIEQRKEIRCLTGAGQHAGGSAFQRRNLRCHIIVRGVLKSRIEIAARFQIEQLAHIFAGIIFEGCRLNNRDLPRLTVSRTIPCLHTFGSN